MRTEQSVPGFNERFPELHDFILRLVADHHAGKITAWQDLEKRVFAFFTSERMEQMDSLLPHWKKMASYCDGMTLVHVTCVFLGLYMLPEFQSSNAAQRNLMQWVVLLHDVEKQAAKGKRDPFHAFRSAVTAARQLPCFGFGTTREYDSQIDSWSKMVLSACLPRDEGPEPIPDNRQFPEILDGIDRMFGKESAAAAIIRTVLFHLSFNAVKEWPQAAPLTMEETGLYVNRELLPLLKAMLLSDNEGWSLFYPERDIQRSETLALIAELEQLIT